MISFMDTSALIKRFINESGSKAVDDIFEKSKQIIVSPITKIEIYSLLKRLVVEKRLSNLEHKKLTDEIIFDYAYFNVISFTEKIESLSEKLINKYQLKALDSIQLASGISIKNTVDIFVTSDKKLFEAAKKERLNVFNPNNA